MWFKIINAIYHLVFVSFKLLYHEGMRKSFHCGIQRVSNHEASRAAEGTRREREIYKEHMAHELL